MDGRGKLQVFVEHCQSRLSSKLSPVDQNSDFAVYSIRDIKPLSLRRNAAKWVVIRAVTGSLDEAARLFRDLKIVLDPKELAIICVIGQTSNLEIYFQESVVPRALLNVDKISKFLFDPEPLAHLQNEITSQIGLNVFNPYDPTIPASDSMFIGRMKELNRILLTRNRGIAIVGQRGIGKSSLLQAAYRRFKTELQFRPYYISCGIYKDYDSFSDHLMDLLQPRAKASGRSYDVYNCLLLSGGHDGNIILFLDDMDVLVDNCSKTGKWELFEHLHKAAVDGVCRLFLAGYKQLRRALFQKDHTLNRLLETLELQALDESDARRLILEPTADLGISFGLPKIIQHIIDWTSCHPSYLQLYMKLLVEKVASGGKTTIQWDDLSEIENSAEFYTNLMNTFLHDTNSLEKSIVYIVLQKGSPMEPTDIRAQLEAHDYSPDMDSVVRACEDLVLANVFIHRYRNYGFLFHGLTEIIKAHQNPDEMLRNYIKDAKRLWNAQR